jgi:hypothetical protein
MHALQMKLNPRLASKLRDPEVVNFSKLEIFQLSLYLCSKPSQDRTSKDVYEQVLEKLVEGVQFFMDLR